MLSAALLSHIPAFPPLFFSYFQVLPLVLLLLQDRAGLLLLPNSPPMSPGSLPFAPTPMSLPHVPGGCGKALLLFLTLPLFKREKR